MATKHITPVLVAAFYILAFILFSIAWQEFQESNEFVDHQCYINSVTVKPIKKKDYHIAVWNVTVKEEFKNKDVLMEEHIYERSSEKALDEAEQKYQIKNVYTCYGPSLYHESVDPVRWRWDKPTKGRASIYFVSGVIAVLMGTSILLLRILCWKKYCVTNRQDQNQQELQISLRNEGQQ